MSTKIKDNLKHEISLFQLLVTMSNYSNNAILVFQLLSIVWNYNFLRWQGIVVFLLCFFNNFEFKSKWESFKWWWGTNLDWFLGTTSYSFKLKIDAQAPITTFDNQNSHNVCFSIRITYTFDNLVNNKRVQLTIMKGKSCDHEEVEILDMKTIDKYETLSDYITVSF